MASVAIAPRSILDFNTTRRSDPESFDLMFETLRRLGYRISDQRSHLHFLTPAFEKSGWSTSDRSLFGFRSRGGFKVMAEGIVHESVHALANRKYGPKTQRRPRFILLTEALASCATVYFDLSYMAHHGPTRRTLDLVERYRPFAKQAGAPLLRNINRGLKDPFATFRQASLDMYEIYEMMLDQQQMQHGNGKYLYQFMKKKTTLMFVLPFDIGNNVLFARAHCGLESSAEDRKICAEISTHLKNATTLYDFLRTFC